MATNNALNIQNTGLVNYDGAGTFTGVTVPEDQALIGGPNNTILGIDPTGFAVGNPICSTGTGTAPDFSATPVCDSITIQNLPTNPTDGANKQYVDTIAGSFSFLDSTVCASTVDVNATYLNGVAGVGATLTNAGTLAPIELDNYNPTLTERVLIKNQNNAFENGVYVVTVVGDSLTPWELTRAADYDQPVEITPGSLVSVLYGLTQADTFWAQTQTITTIGTDPILFVAFAVVPTGVLLAVNNLSDVSNVTVSRSNLGLTNVATQNVTQYAVLTGDASDAINSLPLGSAGQVLTSQGPGAFPIWSTGGGGGTGFSSVNVQVITSTGTYTPSTNMLFCIVELVGGGGAGGGVPNAGSNAVSFAGGGGAAGAYARKIFDAATIGSAQPVVIGVGGTPVNGGNGNNGNASTFGSFLTCNGGGGGIVGQSSSGGVGSVGLGGASPIASGGDINIPGAAGDFGMSIVVGASANFSALACGGNGGASMFSGVARSPVGAGGQNGNPGLLYGGGGSGAVCVYFNGPNQGGAGAPGVCVITEFIGSNAPPPSYSYTLVTNAMSPYTVSGTDNYIGVDSSGGPVSILLPNATTQARTFTIKDRAGDADTNNITITTVGGVTTIDGSTSIVIETSYQSVNIIYNGAAYEVF